MRDYVRDNLGRFADVPGVGNDAINSATVPGGTRTGIPSAQTTNDNYYSMTRAEQARAEAANAPGDSYTVRYPKTTRDIKTGKKTTKIVTETLKVRPGADPAKAAVATWGKRKFTINKDK